MQLNHSAAKIAQRRIDSVSASDHGAAGVSSWSEKLDGLEVQGGEDSKPESIELEWLRVERDDPGEAEGEEEGEEGESRAQMSNGTGLLQPPRRRCLSGNTDDAAAASTLPRPRGSSDVEPYVEPHGQIAGLLPLV
jgi:hypothetical protein